MSEELPPSTDGNENKGKEKKYLAKRRRELISALKRRQLKINASRLQSSRKRRRMFLTSRESSLLCSNIMLAKSHAEIKRHNKVLREKIDQLRVEMTDLQLRYCNSFLRHEVDEMLKKRVQAEKERLVSVVQQILTSGLSVLTQASPERTIPSNSASTTEKRSVTESSTLTLPSSSSPGSASVAASAPLVSDNQEPPRFRAPLDNFLDLSVIREESLANIITLELTLDQTSMEKAEKENDEDNSANRTFVVAESKQTSPLPSDFLQHRAHMRRTCFSDELMTSLAKLGACQNQPDRPEVPRKNSSCTEVFHKIASSPEGACQNQPDSPEVHCKISSCAEAFHKTASSPKVFHKTASSPEVFHKTASSPEVFHKTASSPEVMPCNQMEESNHGTIDVQQLLTGSTRLSLDGKDHDQRRLSVKLVIIGTPDPQEPIITEPLVTSSSSSSSCCSRQPLCPSPCISNNNIKLTSPISLPNNQMGSEISCSGEENRLHKKKGKNLNGKKKKILLEKPNIRNNEGSLLPSHVLPAKLKLIKEAEEEAFSVQHVSSTSSLPGSEEQKTQEETSDLNQGSRLRRKRTVNYKEPSLNCKMRRT